VVSIAAAVVILAGGGGVTAWILQDRVTGLEYAEPRPLPSPSISTVPFAPDPQQFEDLPTGGVGSVLEGLRIDEVSISTIECPDAKACPDTAEVTVTNEAGDEFRGNVFFAVYRNRVIAVSNAGVANLLAGESATVTIPVQPALARNAPPGARGSIYTWNVAVERLP
jgi:hypothetical protein